MEEFKEEFKEELASAFAKIARSDGHMLSPTEVSLIDRHLEKTHELIKSTADLIERLKNEAQSKEALEVIEPEIPQAKREIGFQHAIPDDLEPLMVIGGYTFAKNSESLYVCGFKAVNISKMPIMPVAISPVTLKHLEDMSDDPRSIYNVIYLTYDKEYFLVQMGPTTYIFNELTTSLRFIGAIVDYKASAIRYEFSQSRIHTEV